MAEYTKLVKKDFDKINDYFGLTIDKFETMPGGSTNSSFICNAQKEKLVVTVFDQKSFTDIENLGKILKHLGNEKFPTTEMIFPLDGKCPIMLLSDKPVMVKRFIPGKVIHVLSNEMLFQAGSMMAKLHKISSPDYLRNEHPFGKQLFSLAIGINIDKKYEKWLEERLIFLDKTIPKNLPTSLIHGDLFFHNILFEDNELKAIIDFEEACNYYSAFDIGMGIVGLTIENENLNFVRANNFIQGYQSVSALEEAEMNNLKLFIEYAAIAASFWFFRNYYIHKHTDIYKNKYLEMVNIAINVKSIPDDIFFSRLLKT